MFPQVIGTTPQLGGWIAAMKLCVSRHTYENGSMGIFSKRHKAPHIETNDQFDEMTRGGKPVLIDFYQHGCQPCRVMDGIVDEVAEQFEGTAHVAKANLDNVPDLFYKFKVKSTPTFVVLNPVDGGLHQRWRQSGLVKKDVLADQVSSAIDALPHH
jgi:thioredoxin 1